MSDELDGASHWGDIPPNSSSTHLDALEDEVNETQTSSTPTSSTTKPASTPKLKSRISSLRSSRARKSPVPAVQVESVASADPLMAGPLGGVSSAAPISSGEPIPFASTDKESEQISKAIEHYNSNNERLALFGEDEGASPKRLIGTYNNISTSNASPKDLAEPVRKLSISRSHPPSTPPTTTIPASPPKDVFEISVGDPIKVGDLTSAHTVYTVHTKTSSPNFSKAEAAVTRRYRDFRWIYHALETNNPGVIIPPPPDKQAVGRFNEDFVEARRSALENMLNKIAKHPQLQHDPDFRIFLESDTFVADIKYQSHATEVTAAESKGGFMSSLGGAFSFSGKFVETDEWFIEKKQYVDTLESQFKYLAKALDLVIAQRKELSDSTSEFAAVLETLSEVELSKTFAELIQNFFQTELRIRDLYYRQCMQDVLSLATTLEEYTRIITSIRVVFAQRQKSYLSLQTAEHDLTKKRSHVDKVTRQGSKTSTTLPDKLAVLNADLAEQDRKTLNARVAFDDISKQIVTEFARFELEKAGDFRNSVELFLENAVEAQKEAIEVWETFYQMAGFSAGSTDVGASTAVAGGAPGPGLVASVEPVN